MTGLLRLASGCLGYRGRVQRSASQPAGRDEYHGSLVDRRIWVDPDAGDSLGPGGARRCSSYFATARGKKHRRTETMSHDPVSPELALVDSSLRDRLILEHPGATEAGHPPATAEAGMDPAGWKSHRRRSLVVSAALLVLAVAAAGVGIALFMTFHRTETAASMSSNGACLDRTDGLTGEAARLDSDFAWAPVKGAARYEIQIRRAGKIHLLGDDRPFHT